jgi:hypothetical protein
MNKHAYAFAVLGAFSGGLFFACSSTDATTTDAGVEDGSSADTSIVKKDSGNLDSGIGPDVCNAALPAIPKEVDAEVQCNPITQNCTDPCFSKCNYFSLEAGTSVAAGNFVGCGPWVGDAGLDQPCTRPTDDPGYDTCAKGFSCVSLSTPADASTLRVCRPTCSAQNNCSPNEFCAAMTVPTLPITQFGICARNCDPWTTQCASGDGCVNYLDINNHFNLTCGVVGQTAIGQQCAGGNSCVAGSSCTQVGDSGSSVCAPFCDGTHTCSTGTCATPVPGATFKVCL